MTSHSQRAMCGDRKRVGVCTGTATPLPLVSSRSPSLFIPPDLTLESKHLIPSSMPRFLNLSFVVQWQQLALGTFARMKSCNLSASPNVWCCKLSVRVCDFFGSNPTFIRHFLYARCWNRHEETLLRTSMVPKFREAVNYHLEKCHAYCSCGLCVVR